MIWLSKYLLAVWIFGFSLPAKATQSAPVFIRMRTVVGPISLIGTSIVFSIDDPLGDQPSYSAKVFDSFVVDFLADQLAWVVRKKNSGKVVAQFNGRVLKLQGNDMRLDLRSVPKTVRLLGRPNGKVELVGVVDLEDYVAGVVGAEVPEDWPQEALKAQAVAARSFVLAKIRERSGKRPVALDWHVQASVSDQVFDFDRRHSRAQRAVAETKSEVLTDVQGRVASTHFHADCGGKTDEPKDIWGGVQRLGTVSKDACVLAGRVGWRLVRSLESIGSRLRLQKKLPRGFKLASIGVLGRSAGGRALEIELISRSGLRQNITGENLRAAIGVTELKSTLFKISTAVNGQVEFTGHGFGHGVGLCQWGAQQMASQGRSYREILKHYYPALHL